MNTYSNAIEETIYNFAKLDLDTMSATDKATYIVKVSSKLGMSPNQFLQTMKPYIKASGEMAHIERDLARSIETTVYVCALYKSRQCYRTWIKVR